MTKIIRTIISGVFLVMMVSSLGVLVYRMGVQKGPSVIINNSIYKDFYSSAVEVFKIKDPDTIEIAVAPKIEIETKKPFIGSGLRMNSDKIHVSDRDFDCLARNIFYESAGEPYLGQLAVAQVTWNRLNVGHWGSSLCSVVYSPSQFSWTLESNKRHRKPDGPLWDHAKKVARDFLEGNRVDGMERTKFFHATRINPPVWTKDMNATHVIGGHIFYAMK